jgi:RimJ/RimL family protein N-acetyltransferase
MSKRRDKHPKEYMNNYFTHIIIDEKMKGKGYGTKAIELFIEYIKETNLYDIKKLYATAYEDNTSSIKLHEKVGYKNLGLFEKYHGRNIIILKYTF